MEESKMRLTAKYFITGKIEVITGLHIGGSRSSLDIGGIDLSVIKTGRGVPFIPGSSLKGKLRSLLAKEVGSMEVKDDPPSITEIFGASPKSKDDPGIPARIIVRDAMLDEVHFMDLKKQLTDLELEFTESKWENTINREKGSAEHPRQLERVPAGARFDFEIIYNEMESSKTGTHINDILKAMRLLEHDYLGGQGSRGYGKISFKEVSVNKKPIGNYASTNGQLETTTYTFEAYANNRSSL